MENNNIEKVLDKISNMSKVQIWVSICFGIICFIIAIGLLYYVIFSSKIELNGENIVYILGGLFFSGLVLIILPLYFGKIDKDIQEKIIKEEIKQTDFINILKDLQNYFINEKEYLKPTKIINKFRNWKDIFTIKDYDISIVSVIDDDYQIQNFYIWTKDNLFKNQIQKIAKEQNKKEVNEEEKQKWGYGKDHFVFEKPLELCKKGEYKEAIKFLLEILEKLDYTSKKTD